MASERRLLIEALPNYEIGEEIGRGGWGIVIDASHRTLGRRVAIKQLPRAFGADPSVRERFLAEARVVASLDHPHIVPLYDYVEHEGMCLLVMELMTGGTLWDRYNAGSMSPGECCAVSIAVLSGLAHAHDNDVLHRDVKPENILFNAAGVPKLADFGIAKVVGESAGTRTATGVILGTPAYMAPEQGAGKPVSPATDIYAVGAMLYELLSGRLPFESTGDPLSQLFRHVHEPPDPLRTLVPSIPEPLARAVMHALEKAPADRPVSAGAFARELDDAAAESFGDDWLDQSGVPTLSTRTRRAATEHRAPPSNATIIVEAAASTSAPSTQIPAPVSPAPVSPIPAPATPPTPAAPAPPVQSDADSRALSRRVPLALASVAVIAAVVAVAVILFGGNQPAADGDELSTEQGTDLAQAVADIESACLDSGVPAELCTCAVETAQDELSSSQLLLAARVLGQDGTGLTAELEAVFNTCGQSLAS